MKKKILSIALVVCIAITAIAGATIAYLTDDDEATNTFTVGNVQIELVEQKTVLLSKSLKMTKSFFPL